MLDIQYIRDNPDFVAEKSGQKGYSVDIKQLLGFDEERKKILQQVEELRQKRNTLTTAIKGQKPSQQQIDEGRELRDQINNTEHQYAALEAEFISLLKQVPNMPCEDVPIGNSEDDNVVAKEVGVKPKFNFTPKSHWDLAEARGLIDKERAAKVAGTRFAYIKGDLVKLHFALINYALSVLT
ncbi:MAG TPA: hypothetical protein VFN31_01595, partial [Candidatus Saccharimonadales bacterium]|nr:hypothetical protein [Candidatus Saccharimonadales bacterium]